jgi:hypothetical protein
MNFIGARDILATVPMAPPARLKAHRPNALLYDNPDALPRVTWVGRSRIIAGDQERLSYNGNWKLDVKWDEKPLLHSTFSVTCQ